MKKISLMMIFVFVATLANAQDDFRKFKFGLKGSPNLSWFKPDGAKTDFVNDGVRFRFSYGLVTEFAFGNNYSFFTGVELLSTGGGLNFEDKGYYKAGDDFFLLSKRSYTLNYVNIPLSLKMTTNEVGFMRYFATFGVDLGTRTKARAKDEVKTFSSTGFAATTVTREDIDVLKEVPLFRLGLNIGIGTTYNISGNTDLLVSLNWSNGFVNSLKKESVNINNYDVADYDGMNNDAKKTAFESTDRTKFKQKATNNFVTLNVGIMF